MIARSYAALALASALALMPALPAAAAGRPAAVGGGDPTGTISAIVSATATTPEEIVVTSSTTGSVTYALTPATAYSLTAAGLTGAPTVSAADLAVGETVAVTPAAGVTAGVTDAAAVAIEAQVTMGEVSAVTTSTTQPLSFDVVANGATTAFTAAQGAVVAPSAASLTVGQGAVVYSLEQGGASATAYVVDLSGAFPALSGTIASANGTTLALQTASGTLDFAYDGATAVTVGQSAAGDAYLLPGAQASVESYSVGSAGASAGAISLAASSVSGTIAAVSQQAGGVTQLTVATAGASVTVDVLATTNLGGASPSQLAVGAAVSASGVLVGDTLTAVSLTINQGATGNDATGTIASVTTTALVLTTAAGPMTFALMPTTTVDVASFAAVQADLAAGEQATVTYTSATAAGSTTPVDTATNVTVAPQTLAGTVAASPAPTAGAFTVTTALGQDVSVSVAPDAAVTGTIAAGTQVSLDGVFLAPTTFVAFSVQVQGATTGQPPAQVLVGRVAAVSATTLALAGEDGASVTLTLTPQTQYRLGPASVTAALLAVGEWARVRVAPDATVAGQDDAVAVYLMPRTLLGVVESVSAQSGGTLVTVRGRMIGAWRPLQRGFGRGRGEDGPGLVAGGRLLTLFVPQNTPITALGPAPVAPASGNGTTLQVGEAIAAQGALASQGLIAAHVWTLPLPPGPHGRGPHGPGWGDGPGHGHGHGHGHDGRWPSPGRRGEDGHGHGHGHGRKR